jgi:hypothetical protein
MKHMILVLFLIIFPAACFAEGDDVLATGASLAARQDTSAQAVQPAQPAQAVSDGTLPGATEPAEREDWFNWSSSVSFDDIRKDDNLQF